MTLTWDDRNLGPQWQGLVRVEQIAPTGVFVAAFRVYLNRPATGLRARDVVVQTEPDIPVPAYRVAPVADTDQTIDVAFEAFGGHAPFEVRLLSGGADPLHPFFAGVSFVFTLDCEADDCEDPGLEAAVQPSPQPVLDLFTKDYLGFEALLKERARVRSPALSDLSPASLEATLLEQLAYAADELSYYQDRVANEAYVEAARDRHSVRQHATLMGIELPEAKAASTLLAFEVSFAGTLPSGVEVDAGPSAEEVEVVFHTDGDVAVLPQHNRLVLAAWPGAVDAELSAEADELLLYGHELRLVPGDRLALVQGLTNSVVEVAEAREEEAPGWTPSPFDPLTVGVVPVTRVTLTGAVRRRFTPWSSTVTPRNLPPLVLDLDVAQPSPLTGTVASVSGAPLARAKVTATVGSVAIVAFTGTDGTFVIEGLPASGATRIVASREQSRPQAWEGDIANLASFVPAPFLSGRVTDPEGRALRDATIDLMGTGITTVTDDEGRFSLVGPAGAQTVAVSLPGRVPARVDLLLDADQPAVVDVVLPAEFVIFGNLVEAFQGGTRVARHRPGGGTVGRGETSLVFDRRNAVTSTSTLEIDGTPTSIRTLRAVRVPWSPVLHRFDGITWSPQVEVRIGSSDDRTETWTREPHLHASRPWSLHYTAAVGNDGALWLHFGDGRRGRLVEIDPVSGTPNEAIEVRVRTGDPLLGNCAPGTLSRVHPLSVASSTQLQDLAVTAVQNVTPGQGGTAAMTLERAKQELPLSVRNGPVRRAVTDQDYADVVSEVEGVDRAATRRIGGPFGTLLVLIDASGTTVPTPEVLAAARARVEAVRMAGREVVVYAAELVPLEVHLVVCARPGTPRSELRARIRAELAPGTVERPGWFHPDRLSFATAVRAADVLAAVQRLDGVHGVRVALFKKLLAEGEPVVPVIRLADTQVPRLDADDARPDLGRLRVEVVGLDDIDPGDGFVGLEVQP